VSHGNEEGKKERNKDVRTKESKERTSKYIKKERIEEGLREGNNRKVEGWKERYKW
jgi:hypothetical protein